MPYYFGSQIELSDNVERWEMLEEIWEIIDNDLSYFRFETREEAMRQRSQETHEPDPWELIEALAQYRETDDRENLFIFHEWGLEALKNTKLGIEKREFDSTFLYHWSVLTSCHGFICAALMALDDDMQSKRAGAASAKATSLEKHQQWFAHYYLRENPNCKNREEVEDRIERLVNAIAVGGYPEVPIGQQLWCEKLLSLKKRINIKGGTKVNNPRYGKLTKSFRKDALRIWKMKELVKLPSDGLPPLDLNIPPP